MVPVHPSDEERAWLLDQLGQVLAESGWRRFVLGDVLQPVPRCFPDPFLGGPEGVQTVAYRLLWWAGLRALRVAIVDARQPFRREADWGIEAASLRSDELTLVLRSEGAAEDLPGTLAALLASVTRKRLGWIATRESPYRNESSAPPELEQQLASLQTLELGWGVLATEATQRIRTRGEGVGDWHSDRGQTTEHGSLGLADMTFLLAVQAVVRDREEASRWAKHLRPNQSDLFRKWTRALEADAAGLRLRLGIPDADSWKNEPLTHASEHHPVPFSEEEMGRWTPAQRAETGPADAPVFKVHYAPLRDPQFLMELIGTGAVTVATLGLALLVPTVSGAIRDVGTRFSVPFLCSRCRAELASDAKQCASCGGLVAGVIARQSEWLAAEEALPRSWWIEHGLEPPDLAWAEDGAADG